MKDTDRGQHQWQQQQQRGQNHGDPNCRASLKLGVDSPSSGKCNGHPHTWKERSKTSKREWWYQRLLQVIVNKSPHSNHFE